MKKNVMFALCLSLALLCACGKKEETPEAAVPAEPVVEEDAVIDDAAMEESEAEVNQGEPFMPANFLEEKLQQDTFTSFDDIISQLEAGNAYVITKLYGYDDEVLLIAEGAYDNGDGNMASIEASVYRDDNGVVRNIGNIYSSGTAYPISIDGEGKVYSGGNHDMTISCISEETSAIMDMVYAYESFDDKGNATYGGFVRESNQIMGDETEIAEDDSSVLENLYKEYASTAPLNYTVVE